MMPTVWSTQVMINIELSISDTIFLSKRRYYLKRDLEHVDAFVWFAYSSRWMGSDFKRHEWMQTCKIREKSSQETLYSPDVLCIYLTGGRTCWIDNKKGTARPLSIMIHNNDLISTLRVRSSLLDRTHFLR